MNIEEVLRFYDEKFNISNNEQLIIKALYNENNLTADKIIKKTGIPKGRLYEYLNRLIDKKLILKTSKQPFIYFIDSIEERAVDYFYNSLLREVKKQKQLLDKIDVYESITSIDNMTQFVIMRSREKAIANKLAFIRRDYSYFSFFYPWNNQKEYFKFRTKLGRYGRKPESYSLEDKRNLIFALNTTKETIERGIPIKVVMSKSSFEYYLKEVREAFGKKELENRLISILNVLDNNKNLKLRQVEERFSYDLTITEKSMIFALVEPMPERSFLNGFLLRGKKEVSNYWSIFKTRYNKGTDLKKVIEDKLSYLK